MTNFDLSEKIFAFLKLAQVKTVVVCAGARNASLVMALPQTSFEVVQFFEERSAAFYALGLIKSSGKPVAVLTTSGTAVAELLPAAVEATYQNLPLILITADRPKTYRGSGAPQSIEQTHIFSNYVESVFDLDVYTKDFHFSWSFQKPIQLNVCFDEPLLDQASTQKTQPVQLHRVQRSCDQGSVQGAGQTQSSFSIPTSMAASKNSILAGFVKPLVIMGELNFEQAQQVKKILLEKKIMVYAEALSHLVNDIDLQNQRIQSSDVFIKKAFQDRHFQSVIRIGGVPTIRFWRDLEAEFASVPVLHFSDREWTGLAKASKLFPLASLAEIPQQPDGVIDSVLAADRLLQTQKLELLSRFPFSEPACVAHFSQQVGGSAVYLGNSLPIRHWDSFSVNHSEHLYGNRGANGIDGQVSTYLGWAQAHALSYCLIGDLTALYDMAALGLTSQLKKQKRRVVVLNNFGGQIFQRVMKNKLFINEHQIQFQHWAQMWGWDYLLIKSVEQFNQIHQLDSLNVVIEIQPDAVQTQEFWDQWDVLCRKI